MRASQTSWTAKFLAVVRYEILWNIRKKKFLGMLVVAFALATLSLAGDHIAAAFGGPPVELKPDFVIGSSVGLGGFGFMLFGIVTAMNTISAEFESGTIVPLLAKPVSRTTVFFGKLFGAFLTLLATYCFLMIYMAVGGFVVYGPQNNLHLVPLSLFGALFSTLIWISLVLLLGTLSRSSLIAALGNLGIWLGTTIIGSILGTLAGQLIPFNSSGIEFSMTALFLVIFMNQWKEMKSHKAAFCGLACGILSLYLFGAEKFILPALFATVCLMVLYYIQNQKRGKEKNEHSI